ncbi:MAG: ImmA/IrrE family metallo-endopeptidase [Alphaproteobacteria bacterium]
MYVTVTRKGAHINHTILGWARKDAGFEIAEAAEKAGLSNTKHDTAAERLEAWEKGDGEPTWTQLTSLARVYRRPIITFYLDKPPAAGPDLPDFRTLADVPRGRLSLNLATLVRRVRATQLELIDFLTEPDGAVPEVQFVGSFQISDDVSPLIEDMRVNLNAPFELQVGLSDRDVLFQELRKRAEQAGVYVLLLGNLGSHHSDISLDEFRGFALTDRVAPVVVINRHDAKSAHTFTLMHELAHVWLGASGISNATATSDKEADADIERFCNTVASEFLLPTELVEEAWEQDRGEDIAMAVRAVADRFNVSRTATAWKLWKLRHIQEEDWWRLYHQYRREWEARRRHQSEKVKQGPPQYVVKRRELGNALIQTVLRGIDSGEITYTRASRMLNASPNTIDRLREAVA